MMINTKQLYKFVEDHELIEQVDNKRRHHELLRTAEGVGREVQDMIDTNSEKIGYRGLIG